MQLASDSILQRSSKKIKKNYKTLTLEHSSSYDLSPKRLKKLKKEPSQQKSKKTCHYEPFSNLDLYPIPIQSIIKLKQNLSILDINTISSVMQNPSPLELQEQLLKMKKVALEQEQIVRIIAAKSSLQQNKFYEVLVNKSMSDIDQENNSDQESCIEEKHNPNEEQNIVTIQNEGNTNNKFSNNGTHFKLNLSKIPSQVKDKDSSETIKDKQFKSKDNTLNNSVSSNKNDINNNNIAQIKNQKASSTHINNNAYNNQNNVQQFNNNNNLPATINLKFINNNNEDFNQQVLIQQNINNIDLEGKRSAAISFNAENQQDNSMMTLQMNNKNPLKFNNTKIEDLTEFLEFNSNHNGNQNNNDEDGLLEFEREGNQITALKDQIKQMKMNPDDFVQNLEFEKLLSF